LIEIATALATATSAFNLIKKGFEVGRDVESMGKDVGRWMAATADIKKAEEMAKKPPIFKKLFAAGSVEEEAMQVFIARKKAEDMRNELRTMINMTRGPNAWNELLKTEAEIRKKRQEAIYKQMERRRQVIEYAVCGILFIIGCGFFYWFVQSLLAA
tara:strand:- start:231 stop:701 length:471 start_codon:yes stop_codon:yes gene_type:complete